MSSTVCCSLFERLTVGMPLEWMCVIEEKMSWFSVGSLCFLLVIRIGKPLISGAPAQSNHTDMLDSLISLSQVLLM